MKASQIFLVFVHRRNCDGGAGIWPTIPASSTAAATVIAPCLDCKELDGAVSGATAYWQLLRLSGIDSDPDAIQREFTNRIKGESTLEEIRRATDGLIPGGTLSLVNTIKDGFPETPSLVLAKSKFAVLVAANSENDAVFVWAPDREVMMLSLSELESVYGAQCLRVEQPPKISEPRLWVAFGFYPSQSSLSWLWHGESRNSHRQHRQICVRNIRGNH